jgi:ectoine hydroxylase-related dioxygenase (phytanoyl-CoA dioxygenase family)
LLAWGTVFFTKEPGDPGFVSWHQDTRYAGLEPHEALTAWIALSPATPENGCMRMIPGSHKGPVLPHSDTFGAHNLLTRGQTIQEVDETGAIDVVLQPGQMSLHHLNVIHGSRPNRSRERRMGFAIQHYMPAHIRQTLGEDYALLVRGTDRHGHFKPGRRPTGDVEPEAIAFREHVNKALKDIVYQGATERRSY